MPVFKDSLLEALGAWQNGWGEVQARREELAKALVSETQSLPPQFRSVNELCYRKRFIHKGEFVDLFLRDERDEGVASWTTDLRFAERLKGLVRQNAVSAAIFCHEPAPTEVIVSFPALWEAEEFRSAVQDFANRGGSYAEALQHFRDEQMEVVLQAPIRGSEVTALSGVSSPFDELCDSLRIPESDRDDIFKKLIDSGVYPGEAQLTRPGGAQNAIARMLRQMQDRINQHLSAKQNGENS